jgi:hypothetical protein
MKYLQEVLFVWSGFLGSLGTLHVIPWDSWVVPGLERSLALGIPFLVVSAVLWRVGVLAGNDWHWG